MSTHHDHPSAPAAARRSFTLVEMVVTIGIIVILAVLTVSATVALSQRSEVRQTEDVLTLLDVALQEWETQADRKLSWGQNGYPGSTSVYDMSNGTPHVYTATEMLRVIRRSSAVKSILAQINPEYLFVYDTGADKPPWIRDNRSGDPDPNAGNVESFYDNNDLSGGAPTPVPLDEELAVLDAWGTPIRVVHPGRVAVAQFGDFDPSFELDDDGTVHVDGKNVDGVTFYQAEMLYGEAENRRLRFVSSGPDGKFGDLSAENDTPEHQWLHDNVYSYVIEDEHDEE